MDGKITLSPVDFGRQCGTIYPVPEICNRPSHQNAPHMAPQKQMYGLTVLQHCGSGAFGDVYRCQDASGRQVALKVISKAKVGSGWEREHKGIAHYRSISEDLPNLLHLYHVGEDSESFYYTMELADAQPGHDDYRADTLASRLLLGPLPQEQLLSTLTDILSAIRTLHQAGFAHRDIKPENILFFRGKPKLADLGLLSPLAITMTQLAGTLDFLPPEERSQASPTDNRQSRQRNDLYAFGKIIYCCVTGNNACDFPSTPPSMPLTLVNRHLFRLALRLCDREPTRRLDSLADLEEEFRRTVRLCQYGEGLRDRLHYAGAASWRQVRSWGILSWRLCRRHWVSALVLLNGLLGGSIWLGQLLANRPDAESEELARSLEEQRKEAANTQLAKGRFTFCDGRYSVAVPSEWLIADHDALASLRLPGDVLASRWQGILSPNLPTGQQNTHVLLQILPVTAQELAALPSADERLTLLKPLVCDDMQVINIREFRNPRIARDTILIVGISPPDTNVISYLYPDSDHTLNLTATFPKERFEADMGKFLAITDSLTWRSPGTEPKKSVAK